jgi:hypothetical protein
MKGHLAAIVLCWIVSASSVRTIDGDTFVASIDIWPGLTATGHVRPGGPAGAARVR